MTKRILAVGGAILVLVLFGAGILGGRQPALPSLARESEWGREPVTVAVTVPFYPLQFTGPEGQEGFIPDLLRQAPPPGSSWQATTLSDAEAIAAVRAQSVDLALLVSVHEHDTLPLPRSEPLLSHPVSLFAIAAVPSVERLAGQRVAWSGPEGVAEVLLRLGLEPVSTASLTDCLSQCLEGTVAACAADEMLGIANAGRLPPDRSLLLVAEPLATLDYFLAWHPGDTTAPGAVSTWLDGVHRSGLLESLERKWLGVPATSASPTPRSPMTAVFAGSTAVMAVAAVTLGLSRRSLGRRLEMREKRREKHGQLDSALAEATNQAVFLLDPRQASIIEANRRATELTGYPPSTLKRMRFLQLVPARQRRLLRQWFLRRDGPEQMNDVPLVRDDGTVVTVEISAHPLQEGESDFLLCLVTDTTAPARLQREIMRVTRLADCILESMSDGVLIVDADDRVTSWNRAFADMSGSGTDLSGKHVDEVLRSSSGKLSGLVDSVLSSGDTVRRPMSLGNDHGQWPCAVTASPLRDGQAVTGTLLTFANQPDEGKEGVENRRLAMLSALGQMSGVLAHDIRNRVTGVNVGVQYLAEKFAPDDPRREAMQFIRTETDLVMQIIDDILTLIRPGKMERSACRLPEILDRLLRNQATLARERRVDLTAAMPPGVPAINGDAVQLERALGNLVKNAIEASPSGGKVRVSVEMSDSGANGGTADRLWVRISDNGPGIPPNVQSRLFQPFVSEKPKGTGLGLSIAKRIIDEHGGSLEVETRQGQGTTFIVTLPAAERGD